MSLFTRACDAITEYIQIYGFSDRIWSRKEVIDLIKERCPEVKEDGSNMSPTDICYNRCNGYVMTKDFASWPHALLYVDKGEYKLVGNNYPYTGTVIWNKEKVEYIVFGEWFNGVFREFPKNEQITCEEYNRNENGFVETVEKQLVEAEKLGIDREALVKVRCNQGEFRKRLLNRYSSCLLCRIKEEGLLVASHIKPWSVCKGDEKIDPDNGFIFCPNHDKLFDRGYISFDDDGRILISKELGPNDKVLLNIRETDSIRLCEGNKRYLEYHRGNIYKE